MFAPEQRFSEIRPVVSLSWMCFTELATFSVHGQVEILLTRAFLVVGAAAFVDGVLSCGEETFVACVPERVSSRALARVSW